MIKYGVFFVTEAFIFQFGHLQFRLSKCKFLILFLFLKILMYIDIQIKKRVFVLFWTQNRSRVCFLYLNWKHSFFSEIFQCIKLKFQILNTK